MNTVKFVQFGNNIYALEPSAKNMDYYFFVNIFTRQYVGIKNGVLVNVPHKMSRRLFSLKKVDAESVIIMTDVRATKYGVAYSKNKGYFLSLTKSVALRCFCTEYITNELIMNIIDNLQALSNKLSSVQNLLQYNLPVSNVPRASGKLREYQNESASFLAEFDELCTKLGIKFWLCAGTLLGAVRHKGFIPWDDDLDVNMMDGDFQKLKKYMIENDRFISDESGNISKIKLKKIEGIALVDFDPLVYRLRKMNQGKFNPTIDIFVNYNIPSNRSIREQYNLLRRLNNASLRVKKHKGVVNFREYLDRKLTEISQPENADYIFRGSQQAKLRKSTYEFFLKFVFSTQEIFPLAKLEFENHDYYVPKDYEKYLNDAYGDFYSYPKDGGLTLRHSFREITPV